jgi:hypothetical protein
LLVEGERCRGKLILELGKKAKKKGASGITTLAPLRRRSMGQGK